MTDGFGFVLAVMGLGVVALSIGLRVIGFSWREIAGLMAQAMFGVVFLIGVVILVAALGAPAAPVR